MLDEVGKCAVYGWFGFLGGGLCRASARKISLRDLGNSPSLRRRDMDNKLIVKGFWRKVVRLGRRLVQGIRPEDSASRLGNSPTLRRRDMDK
ncbi:MAG: hypothetical protein LH618_11605 [Saprospiraceae bacterium]|nr:hypothetical protein [Saprospiraceae bacterium]